MKSKQIGGGLTKSEIGLIGGFAFIIIICIYLLSNLYHNTLTPSSPS